VAQYGPVPSSPVVPVPSPPAPSTHTALAVLASSDPKFSEIEQQFTKKWLHKTTPGTVKTVICVEPSQQQQDRFDDYVKQVVKNRPNLSVFGKGGPGNTHRRFHGTPAKNWLCVASMATSRNPQLCSNQGCAVCSIARTGLVLSKSGSNFSWGRYGRGIYLSSASSKSNDYTNPANPAKPSYRAMFVCGVVVGKGKKLQVDASNLTEPPAGFDSVLGEVGQNLNYDEVVVYTEAAVLPKYLIIYTV
jgi:hypothetical protein